MKPIYIYVLTIFNSLGGFKSTHAWRDKSNFMRNDLEKLLPWDVNVDSFIDVGVAEDVDGDVYYLSKTSLSS